MLKMYSKCPVLKASCQLPDFGRETEYAPIPPFESGFLHTAGGDGLQASNRQRYNPPRGCNQTEFKRFSNADRFSNRNQNASSQVVFQLEINESSSSHHSSDNKHSLESVPHLPGSCLLPVPCRSHCIASCHARTPTLLGCNPSGHPASVGPACRRPVS